MTRGLLRAVLLGLLGTVTVAAPAHAARAAAPPVAMSLDGGATRFFNYDFTSATIGTDNHSWPVNLLFTGNASELKVKVALAHAFPWVGSIEYGRVSQGPLTAWDVDFGRKSRLCSVTETSVHYRLYSPPFLGRFVSPNPVFGRYVVGTAHLDKAECGPAPQYGWSEEAEDAVASAASRRGWAVEKNSVDLGNVEALRIEGNHIWQSNGKATVIHVP